jgi:two-component system, response regulator PdtaR
MKALRVLIVEDDALIGMLLAEMLAGMGHEVCAIETTEASAVTDAIRCRPDLIIADVQLGDGSGVSAVAEIRRTRPVPHVFVSGDISRINAIDPNAVVLKKPFREADLGQGIQRALDGA